MTTLRMKIDDKVIYEGAANSVPRVGDAIRHGDETVRVEWVEWDFGETDVVTVTISVGDRPYTF